MKFPVFTNEVIEKMRSSQIDIRLILSQNSLKIEADKMFEEICSEKIDKKPKWRSIEEPFEPTRE